MGYLPKFLTVLLLAAVAALSLPGESQADQTECPPHAKAHHKVQKKRPVQRHGFSVWEYYTEEEYFYSLPPPTPVYGEPLLPCAPIEQQAAYPYGYQPAQPYAPPAYGYAPPAYAPPAPAPVAYAPPRPVAPAPSYAMYTPPQSAYAPPAPAYGPPISLLPGPSGQMCFEYDYTMHEPVLYVRPLTEAFDPRGSVPEQILNYGVQPLAFHITAQPHGRICLDRQTMAQYRIVSVLICEIARDKGYVQPRDFRRLMAGLSIGTVPVGDRQLIAQSRRF